MEKKRDGWGVVVVLLIMGWVFTAHSWAVQAIMPEFQAPELVEEYAPTPKNWRQHMIDMGENDVKRWVAEEKFDLAKSIVNKRFYSFKEYWIWMGSLLLCGGIFLIIIAKKGGQYWRSDIIRLWMKYGVAIWLIYAAYPDPFRFNSPVLATIMLIFLLFNGFGKDPVSLAIQKRKGRIEVDDADVSRYNHYITVLALGVIAYFQLRIATDFYWPQLNNDGYSGAWISEDIWAQVRNHVLWLCRSFMAVVLSVTTVKYHYLAFEVANAVSAIKRDVSDEDTPESM